MACWIAAHAAELELSTLSALELGCGLGLPGLASAAFGAASVDVTDCLPLLLRSVRASIDACGFGGRCRASLLDWDHEAPPAEVGAATDEEYSTEQGVKAAQLAAADSAGSNAVGALGDGGELATGSATLEPGATFGLLLASDVIYSFTHAAQLPLVIARRLAPGGRLCMMVPVRDEAHTRTFLRGLCTRGLHVDIERVNPDWTARVIAVQAPSWKASVAARAAPPRLPEAFQETLGLTEGEVLFVLAQRVDTAHGP